MYADPSMANGRTENSVATGTLPSAPTVVVAMGGYHGNSIAVRVGGAGNVTDDNRLWQEVRHNGGIGSGIAKDGKLYYQDAGGIAIQAVDDKQALPPLRVAFPHVIGQSEISRMLLFACMAHGQKSAALVHDQDVPVLVKDRSSTRCVFLRGSLKVIRILLHG